MSLLGVTAKVEPEKEQAMSLVITLPQSQSMSSSSGIGMTQIKNRNLPHAQQRNSNSNTSPINTDHLTILSSMHPISRSSARKSSQNKKALLIRVTIIGVFILSGVLLFSDQILTSWNNTRGPATAVVSKEKMLHQQQQQQQQRINTNDFIVEEIDTIKNTMAGDGDNSNEQEDLMIEGTVIIGGGGDGEGDDDDDDDDQKIAYYHQAAASSSTSIQQHSLVLLHGSKFTKEDWIQNSSSSTSKNIISLFHQQFPYSISITAVDLPVKADYNQLVSLLEAMQDKGLISLPVSIVTPSASGFIIVDWIMNDDQDVTNKLPTYIHTWIPVASGSVLRFTNEQLTKIDLLEDFSIFAINGNLDKMGKKVTKKLVKHTSTITKSIELKGGHPVYLDSPNEFVNAIGFEITA
ncbi:hypothetical protein FRACYDRAFT_246706 [Fragilariopsis cylindrus CCMP1102]|uniref:Uncharacterized protein n=1 Tax=Fragilariopsis cylindrus CCMP1102 TaxID=635003 RepID=A0A1E7EYC1_9STRA|nr:hypothetical protein FRACYDRAFT_246706 [Fragilariopsis cylindrus CCMP1102]|eukprot:OEU10834.1 hypothetical protein FRACYDRAFT_246706 [Fragilariopsis cylindrus CCMP1102]